MMSSTQKYQVNQYTIKNILNWVDSEEMAIPEIQRPFVWNKKQVTNLIDSLYRGFPVGYLIAWKNPKIRMKDGTLSGGKKILIDGQQRVTALTTSVLGREVVNDDYFKERIQIAFNPITEEFASLNPAIEKDSSWIHDVGPIINGTARISQIIRDYCKKNPKEDELIVEDHLENLKQVSSKQIGFVELEPELDIDTVNEIFVRVNSAGVQLSQADFVMSKIATYGIFGSNLRKCIDYFCNLAVAPEFITQLEKVDTEFHDTEYFKKIEWLKNENDDLYDPGYTDMLRVAFTSQFNRGKMGDLVSLLSGRNFETKTYESDIQSESFKLLEKGILKFANETNFKRFLMIIKSAGFIDSSLIQSQNAVNFAYILYLKLRNINLEQNKIETLVRRWYVMSVLTGRYSASPESMYDQDVKKISKDFEKEIQYVEDTELSDAFWDVQLVTELEKSNRNNPFLSVFFASQVKEHDMGFLSTDIPVSDLISERGDVHHIFPKNYIKKKFNSRRDYNQIANYVFTQTEINIAIKDTAPSKYFDELKEQCSGGEEKYGGINKIEVLKENMKQNCIPESIFEMTVDDYFEFLNQRRVLMAKKIKEYYQSL